MSNAILNIPGYCIEPELKMDQTDTLNGIGGGLIVYAKENLIIKPLPRKNEFNMFDEFEIISGGSVDIVSQSEKNLTITLVYICRRVHQITIQKI